MKKTIIISLLILILLSCSNNENKIYLPIKKDGKFGYISYDSLTNETEIIVEPIFITAYEFHQGRAAVNKDRYFGYINTDGEYVVSPRYDWAYDYKESTGLVVKKRFIQKFPYVKYGFVNYAGFYIAKLIFDDAKPFSEGLAAVKIENDENFKEWGYMDKEGKKAIDFQYHDAFSFHEGYAKVMVNGKFGYINKTGGYVLIPEYDGAENISIGFALVYKLNEYEEKEWFFININGEVLTDKRFKDAKPFTNKYAPVQDFETEKYGYINLDSEIEIDFKFEKAEQFNERLAGVKSDSLWGFINYSGRYIIEPQYDEVRKFHEGLAAVRRDSLWTYVDAKGNHIADFEFDRVFDFRFGSGRVEKGEKIGYINKKGEYIWELSQ